MHPHINYIRWGCAWRAKSHEKRAVGTAGDPAGSSSTGSHSRCACSSCCKASLPLPCRRSVEQSAGLVRGSHKGERLLCHAGSLRAPGSMAGKQQSDEKVSVSSSLATAAGTSASSCALLRNLGVGIGGFGPHTVSFPGRTSSYPSQTQRRCQHLKTR